MKNVIILKSGQYFDFDEPENSKFSIEDIAHSLAHQCRFTGHTPYHYSVAQHCINCAHVAPPEHRLNALLHDAAETFIGDVSSPLKKLLPDYAEIEERVERAIFKNLGCPYPISNEVKVIDKRMLVTEQHRIFRNQDRWLDFSPYSVLEIPDSKFRERSSKAVSELFVDLFLIFKAKE